MPHDVDLADRLRAMLAAQPNLHEKKLFGGVAFLLNGHLAVCASGQGDLMVRVDPANQNSLLSRPGVTPMEMQGRPMSGWVRVQLAQVRTAGELQSWVDRGTACARALPPKTGQARSSS